MIKIKLNEITPELKQKSLEGFTQAFKNLIIQKGYNRIKLPETIEKEFNLWGKISDEKSYFYTLFDNKNNIEEKIEKSRKAIEALSARNNATDVVSFNIIIGEEEYVSSKLNEYNIFISLILAEGQRKLDIYNSIQSTPFDTIETTHIIMQEARYPAGLDKNLDSIEQKMEEAIKGSLLVGRAKEIENMNSKYNPNAMPFPITVNGKSVEGNESPENGHFAPGQIFIRRINRARVVANTPFLALFFLTVNVTVYLIMQIGFGGVDFDEALFWGGATYFHIFTLNEYYRIFTSMFMHLNTWHIIFNSMAIFIFATRAERYFGHIRFFLIYMLSGIVGAVAMVYAEPTFIGVGASGAIFGIIGSLIAFMLVRRQMVENLNISSLVILLVLNFAFSLAPGSGISNAAHLGGLVTGFVLGIPFFYPYRKKQ